MKTSVNEVVDDNVLIKRYEKEIDRLRSQLRAKHESHANETLREENRKLREDNQKLVAFISKNAHKLKGGAPANTDDTQDVNNDTSGVFDITEKQQLSARFNEKLALLEQIEEDQTRREEELEKYHRWLHSIPLHIDKTNEGDKEYAVTVDNKIKLLEQSLKVHMEENERAKKLYLRDLKIMQTEIKEKAEDIEIANEQIINLKNQLAFQQNPMIQTTSSPNESEATSPSLSDLSNEDMLPNNNEQNKDQQTFSALLQRYEAMKGEISLKVESGIDFFRKKLTTIVLEHIQDEILTHPDATEEEMHEELQTLISGCCEALNERVVNSQKVFNEQAHAVLKSLYDISLKMGNKARKERLQLLKRMRQMKKKSPLDSSNQSSQTSYPLPPVSLSEMVKSSISMTTNKDTKDTAYWNSVVTGVSTMRDFQATLYVRTVALKNTIERIAEQVESFTKKEDNLDFHRTQLTIILKHLQEDIKKYEQETFMKQSALVRRSTLLPRENDKVAALVNAQSPIKKKIEESSDTPRTPQHELAQRALGDILDYQSPHQVMFRKLNEGGQSSSPTTPTIQSSIASLPIFNPEQYSRESFTASPISSTSTTPPSSKSPPKSVVVDPPTKQPIRKSPDPASPPPQQAQNISTASLKKRLAEISRDMSKLDTNLRKMA
eukprot:CAMPEP_0117421836 /NCGR_PEP_ID=MMETSP0758-20121206/2812_1 /TAXON_ID=63605 /ORGANISM="Percolomonas cosmopolitus, Strain AE-1 (ATCC 50343)" /LENGTH=663 /DNA_ID=CAMNT_0005204127 /DNA_START=891 /DNA_END=2879 /DNA_ORIENTATION=+